MADWVQRIQKDPQGARDILEALSETCEIDEVLVDIVCEAVDCGVESLSESQLALLAEGIFEEYCKDTCLLCNTEIDFADQIPALEDGLCAFHRENGDEE
ncbi:MAG: hypothetical protein Q8Q18_01865 [bacterium]|nr:hypothetical protein [bacterium]